MKIDYLISRSFEENEETLAKLLHAKLEETGISKTQFGKLSNIHLKSLDPILTNESKTTDIIKLLKIGEFLDLEIEEMLILFLKGRPSEDIKELQQVLELTYIHKHFDLKTLSSLGFLSTTNDLETIKSRIIHFFGLNQLYDYDRELNEALYSRTKVSYDDKMKDFWIKASYRYFEAIDNPHEYDRAALVDLLPKIKPYTANVKDGLLTVIRALYYVGVTVVFQPLLPKTQIRGATFLSNDKPCIVITDYRKNYATIWFALIHELHHVLYDLETIAKTKYHLSGEPDLFLMQEDKANRFAQEFLFSEAKLKQIRPFINNKILVRKAAEQSSVHPSIIYGAFQFWMSQQGENYWKAFGKEFPDINLATEKLNQSNWSASSIEQSAIEIRKILTVN